MRVNARLDDERADKLRELQSLTGLSASDVLKQALDTLHQQQVVRARERLDALLASDFIGCAEGLEDLSSEYKRYLAEDLSKKHGAG